MADEPFQGCAEVFATSETRAGAVIQAREMVDSGCETLYVDYYPKGGFWIVWCHVANFQEPKKPGSTMRIDLRELPKRMQTLVEPRKKK